MLLETLWIAVKFQHVLHAVVDANVAFDRKEMEKVIEAGCEWQKRTA